MVLITGSDFSVTCTELAQLGVGKRLADFGLSIEGCSQSDERVSPKRYVVITKTKKPAYFDDARCANGHASLNRGTVWLTKDVSFCDTGYVSCLDGTRPLISYT